MLRVANLNGDFMELPVEVLTAVVSDDGIMHNLSGCESEESYNAVKMNMTFVIFQIMMRYSDSIKLEGFAATIAEGVRETPQLMEEMTELLEKYEGEQ